MNSRVEYDVGFGFPFLIPRRRWSIGRCRQQIHFVPESHRDGHVYRHARHMKQAPALLVD
jgi:hypothetical protein